MPVGPRVSAIGCLLRPVEWRLLGSSIQRRVLMSLHILEFVTESLFRAVLGTLLRSSRTGNFMTDELTENATSFSFRTKKKNWVKYWTV